MADTAAERPSLPAALIEKMAAALNDPTMFFVETPEHMREWIDRAVQRVAAALLDECDVCEEYWVAGFTLPMVNLDRARREARGRRVSRRIRIWTPAEPVEEP